MRRSIWPVVIALLLALGVVSAGCGSGGGLPIAGDWEWDMGSLEQDVSSGTSVQIFLADDADPVAVESLQTKIAADSRVASIGYTSKEEALAKFKQQMSDAPEVLEQIEGNPLPASLDIILASQSQTEAFVTDLLQSSELVAVVDRPENPKESLKYSSSGLFENLEDVGMRLHIDSDGRGKLSTPDGAFAVGMTVRASGDAYTAEFKDSPGESFPLMSDGDMLVLVLPEDVLPFFGSEMVFRRVEE